VQGAPARQAEPTYAMRTALKPAVRPGGNAGKPAGEARAAAADPRPGELIPVAAGAKAGPPAPISQAAQPVQATPAGGASSPVPESAAPDIRLSAIAWDADPARRIVIMNDRILHEGETLGQTKVARIEADHVELIRDGLSVVKRLKDDSGR
jgi:hypothetical protein